MESILVYGKKEKSIGKLIMGETTDKTKRIDNASNNFTERFITKGIRYFGLPNSTISKGRYQNITMATEFLDDVIVKDGIVQNNFRAMAKFRNRQEEIDKFCSDNLIYITANNSFRRYKTTEEMSGGKTITDLLLDWGQNQDANNELKKLFNITDDSKIFSTPKPELLIHNMIACSTEEDDIILDFFLGSGTTAAVAHKMGRRYIGVEQMDYIDEVAIERLKKVISGEQGGISRSVNWKGGGSFVYFELKELNQKYVNLIQNASNDEELQKIWEGILSTGFISSDVKPQEINTDAFDFKELSIEDKKHLLMELIDKNMLYVNLCDIDDEEFAISDDDKAFTKSFYGEV